MKVTVSAVHSVHPNISVLVVGGIANGEDVYNVIMAVSDATGSSSGIALAKDSGAIINEMLKVTRHAWDD